MSRTAKKGKGQVGRDSVQASVERPRTRLWKQKNPSPGPGTTSVEASSQSKIGQIPETRAKRRPTQAVKAKGPEKAKAKPTTIEPDLRLSESVLTQSTKQKRSRSKEQTSGKNFKRTKTGPTSSKRRSPTPAAEPAAEFYLEDTELSRITSSQSFGEILPSIEQPTGIVIESFCSDFPGWKLGIMAAAGDVVETPVLEDETPKKYKVLSFEKLLWRRIGVEPTDEEDNKNIELAPKFKKTSSILTPQMLQQVKTLAQMFVTKIDSSGADEDCSGDLEKMLTSINSWKPSQQLPYMTNPEFVIDIKHCRSSNEAVLQRTIMISIIDRFHLTNLFTYNCEGQFSLRGTARVPATVFEDSITMPKPDLAVFFNYKALDDNVVPSAPYPPNLLPFLKPDGGSHRCFPFFFLEAKKSSDNLDIALRTNLHSASQALYNIFQWFLWLKASYSDGSLKQTQVVTEKHPWRDICDEEIFFKNVRVFTAALNADSLEIRIHRAQYTQNRSNLSFLFEEVVTLKPYTGHSASHVVRTILVEYAQRQLLPIVKAVFEEVSNRYAQICRQKEEKKRKNKRGGNVDGTQTPKRSRSIASPLSATPTNLYNSFTMEDA